jgi:hypothetical protein
MQIDSIAFQVEGLMLGYPGDLNRCEGRLRIVDGRMTESYTRLPGRNDVGVASTSPLLASPVAGLHFDQQGLVGTLKVRVGHHDEAWQIDLKRDGNSLSGTCERHIAALPQPLKVAGTINGKIERKEDGATWQIFSLEEAATQRPTDPKHARVVAHLVVETKQDGTAHHFVRAGQMNRATHELDASGLVITSSNAKGTMKVIYHADPWIAPNPDTGGPLAAEYQIEAKIKGETITGKYTGALGVEYKASAASLGIYRSDQGVD